ncbi:MAG TPA: hypothetical protein VHH36_00130 [Candidatus Thermoplasmatota archaeon]|nr:hypothetical protein [Candidatus Thermoplasmatota archaeon]
MRVLAFALALLPLAGCVATPEEPVEPESTDAGLDAPVPEPAVHEVAHAGTTQPGAFLCAPIDCVGQYAPDHKASWQEKVDGAIVGAALMLTWTAASPATQELLLGIAWRDGESWTYEVATGASPLMLQSETLEIPAGAEVFVYVNPLRCEGDAGVYACASGPAQAFDLAGVLLAVPETPPAASTT